MVEILGMKIEVTSALAVAGMEQYLQKNPQAKKSEIISDYFWWELLSLIFSLRKLVIIGA